MAVRESARRKLTYDDCLHLPQDGKRYEILDGDLYVTAAPSPKHQRTLRELLYWLHSFLREHRLGEVFSAPLDVLLSRHDTVQPDLLYISNERLLILRERNIRGAPDLVVEILSPSTRRMDEDIKLRRYEALGVREYWLIDPTRQAARIYRRSDERLGLEEDLAAAAGDLLSSQCPAGCYGKISERGIARPGKSA